MENMKENKESENIKKMNKQETEIPKMQSTKIEEQIVAKNIQKEVVKQENSKKKKKQNFLDILKRMFSWTKVGVITSIIGVMVPIIIFIASSEHTDPPQEMLKAIEKDVAIIKSTFHPEQISQDVDTIKLVSNIKRFYQHSLETCKTWQEVYSSFGFGDMKPDNCVAAGNLALICIEKGNTHRNSIKNVLIDIINIASILSSDTVTYSNYNRALYYTYPELEKAYKYLSIYSSEHNKQTEVMKKQAAKLQTLSVVSNSTKREVFQKAIKPLDTKNDTIFLGFNQSIFDIIVTFQKKIAEPILEEYSKKAVREKD